MFSHGTVRTAARALAKGASRRTYYQPRALARGPFRSISPFEGAFPWRLPHPLAARKDAVHEHHTVCFVPIRGLSQYFGGCPPDSTGEEVTIAGVNAFVVQSRSTPCLTNNQ